jgi:hypothetical protein
MLHCNIPRFHVKRFSQALFCYQVISGIIAKVVPDGE